MGPLLSSLLVCEAFLDKILGMTELKLPNECIFFAIWKTSGDLASRKADLVNKFNAFQQHMPQHPFGMEMEVNVAFSFLYVRSADITEARYL